MGQFIEVATLDKSAKFAAYCARPVTPPSATIIVIQEIFGVNAGIRRKCDYWAGLGYLAIAPDLFWRLQPKIDLDPDVPEQMQQGLAFLHNFSGDEAMKDIEACIRWARAESNGGKVGAVGYCLGGRLAYLTATRTDIDASVGYYGVMIDQLLGEAHALAKPLMLHIPTADHFVTPDKQAAIHAALDAHPKVTLFNYDGLDHGFATETGGRRNEAGARLADGRTEAFFAEWLR